MLSDTLNGDLNRLVRFVEELREDVDERLVDKANTEVIGVIVIINDMSN
jgi:hypothetical protein